MFKNYGLTGKSVKVKKKLQHMSNSDPWGNVETPMKVLAEYPNFLLVEVLPHRNPKGYGMSRPYRTTLHKNDLQIGEILLKVDAV